MTSEVWITRAVWLHAPPGILLCLRQWCTRMSKLHGHSMGTLSASASGPGACSHPEFLYFEIASAWGRFR